MRQQKQFDGVAFSNILRQQEGIGSRYLYLLSVFKLAKDIDVKYLLYMGKYKNEAKSIFGDGCTTFDDIM